MKRDDYEKGPPEGRKSTGTINMTESKKIQGFFRYEQDSKRFHCFQIETDAGIVGAVYVPKTMEKMPKKLILKYGGNKQFLNP